MGDILYLAVIFPYKQMFIIISAQLQTHSLCLCVCLSQKTGLIAVAWITKQQRSMMLLRCINTDYSLSNLLQKKKIWDRGSREKERGGGRPGIKIRLALENICELVWPELPLPYGFGPDLTFFSRPPPLLLHLSTIITLLVFLFL